ncbi:MAG: hypothetical protein K0R18_165 [Bacillales bacterium]|jgi:hypothetical protein|nr:hypothetical protein [Bacillales bacterium]
MTDKKDKEPKVFVLKRTEENEEWWREMDNWLHPQDPERIAEVKRRFEESRERFRKLKEIENEKKE